MGVNAFDLNIPPFLGLHPVFNVDLLRPYFPPLLDTSEVAKQLTLLHTTAIYSIKGTTTKPTLSSHQRVAPAPMAKFNRNFLI
jgi:hypothetical protein